MHDPTVSPPSDPLNSELVQLRQRVTDLESRLSQAQKLLTIGRLASGVAHDFNNLLTAILGYASMLRSDPSATPQIIEAVDVIEKAADRASHLTSQLLGFAKQGEPQRSAVDLHVVLRELVDLLRHSIEKNIRIDTQLEATKPTITGDAGQMFQVFLNLALNARDAMPQGGTLTLLTETLDETVRVSVIDSGVGIQPQIRDRIFDPFFTTKPPEKGTGMGLSVVHTVVAAHGGRMEVDTDKAFGTVFTVILPVAGSATLEPGRRFVSAPSRGKGSVMVVDDEDVVRQTIAGMLRRLGYHVISAANAMEAIEHYRRRGRDIDVIILDLLMPEMSGESCFEVLMEMDPQVRVVLTSGHRTNPECPGAKAFLPKPYRMQEISEVLSDVFQR